jgi:o-succinylbenzoate synthase
VTALRVASARLWRFRLPFARPVATARGPVCERRGLVLELQSDGGERGLGEAAPFPGLSDEPLPFVENALERLSRAGSPLFSAALEGAGSVRHLLGALGLPSSAAHAVDQALLAMLAARRGISPAHLLHPVARTDIPVHALALGPEDAASLAQRGYRTLKIKVGAATLAEDDERVASIRRAVGPKVALRLDANGAWSPAQAIRAIQKLWAHGIESVEQPVGARDLEGMRQVRASAPVPIAADESVRTAQDLAALLRAEAADAVVVKPMLAGGVLAAHALACAAADAGLSVSVTTSFESSVGRAAARDVAAACPAPLWSCGLDTGHLLAQDLDAGALGALAQLVPTEASAPGAILPPLERAGGEVIPFPGGRR